MQTLQTSMVVMAKLGADIKDQLQHSARRKYFATYCKTKRYSDEWTVYTYGDSDVILFHIYASWFLPPSCR